MPSWMLKTNITWSKWSNMIGWEQIMEHLELMTSPCWNLARMIFPDMLRDLILIMTIVRWRHTKSHGCKFHSSILDTPNCLAIRLHPHPPTPIGEACDAKFDTKFETPPTINENDEHCSKSSSSSSLLSYCLVIKGSLNCSY